MYQPATPPLAMSFHSMLEYRLKSSGVETPNHHLLGGVMINTMAILVCFLSLSKKTRAERVVARLPKEVMPGSGTLLLDTFWLSRKRL